MIKIRGIEIKKSVGVAFLGTLIIGIIAGIAISDYLLSDTATFNIDVQSSLYPLTISVTEPPAINEKFYMDRWYNLNLTVNNNDDTHAYEILFNISITVTGIADGDIEMEARVKGEDTDSWSTPNYTLTFTGTDTIWATFLGTYYTIAKNLDPDDTLIAQIFFRIPSIVDPPTGSWDVDIWVIGYETT